MVLLRVICDGILERSPRGIARYSEELTRALIERAPRDCGVEAIVSAVGPEDLQRLDETLPGLHSTARLPLGRRELRAAWQRGFTTRSLGGMVHAPTLFAPLKKHDRSIHPGDQTVVTIHDAAPWELDGNDENAEWLRQMAKRAAKYADAVVVPTHATADALARHLDFGDRIRVIGGAVSLGLTGPAPVGDDSEAPELPAEYVLAIGTLAPRKGLEQLMRAAASAAFPVIPLVVVGPDSRDGRTFDQAIFESGAPEGRVIHLPPLADHHLAHVIRRATVMVVPSEIEGFGLPALEAMQLGTPVVHSDDDALVEVVAGAGVSVERFPREGFAERLAVAIADTVGDPSLIEDLVIQGRDRARAFSWQDSADRTWQLHAEL